jgi:hypothetical protein
VSRLDLRRGTREGESSRARRRRRPIGTSTILPPLERAARTFLRRVDATACRFARSG